MLLSCRNVFIVYVYVSVLTRSFHNAVKFGKPGWKHRLFAKSIYLWQRPVKPQQNVIQNHFVDNLNSRKNNKIINMDLKPDSFLDVISENLPEVVVRACPRLYHLFHSLWFQEHVMVRLDCVLKRFVCQDLCLAFKESLWKVFSVVKLPPREYNEGMRY